MALRTAELDEDALERSRDREGAEFGFVGSSAEAETIVKRRWMLEHANNAHTWNFDHESCGPTLAFAA